MRLPDFSFPGDTLESIRSRAAEFNSWIEKVKEENFVKIGVPGEGEPRYLPGIPGSIKISDGLLVDSAELADKSGSVKIISGWADADVTVNLLLIDLPEFTSEAVTPAVTRFDCLREIAGIFKRMKDGTPRVFTILHPHIAAWGLREFVFNKLESSESRGRRVIACALEFDEFDGVSGKSQDRQMGAQIAIAEAEAPVNPPVGDDERAGLGKLEARFAKQ